MGVVFNGMAIAAGRHVAAPVLYPALAQNQPEPDDDTTRPEDDTNFANPIDTINDGATEVLEKTCEVANDPKAQAEINDIEEGAAWLKETLDGIKKASKDANEAIDIVTKISNAIDGLVKLAKNAHPLTALINAALEGLKDLIVDQLEKAAGEAVKKEVKDALDDAFNDLMNGLKEDALALIEAANKVAANSKHPANMDSAVSHSFGAIASEDGHVIYGSPNVFFGGAKVARVYDSTDCTSHAVTQVAEGSATVFANGSPIARVGNQITCSAIITTGVTSIFIDTKVSSQSVPVTRTNDTAAADLTLTLAKIYALGDPNINLDETGSLCPSE